MESGSYDSFSNIHNLFLLSASSQYTNSVETNIDDLRVTKDISIVGPRIHPPIPWCPEESASRCLILMTDATHGRLHMVYTDWLSRDGG